MNNCDTTARGNKPIFAGNLSLFLRLIFICAGVAGMTLLTWVNSQPEAAGVIAAPWDKLVHAAYFGTLAILLALGFTARRIWIAIMVVVVFAMFDELRQLDLPGRSASWGDFVTDVVAAVMGALVVAVWARRRQKRR